MLGIDDAIEKVFKETEREIGSQKLIECNKFLCSSSSLFTIGLIAITKLISPSHSAHSVSLYSEFTTWMSIHEIDDGGFKGFVANRIGRIAYLAQQFIILREHIHDFFRDIVDASANKLVRVSCEYFRDKPMVQLSSRSLRIGW